MQPVKRIFLIVLDSFGVGEAPDAADFGDEGSDTLGAVSHSPYFDLPNLDRLGLFCLDGVTCRPGCAAPIGSFARLTEASPREGYDDRPLGACRPHFAASAAHLPERLSA